MSDPSYRSGNSDPSSDIICLNIISREPLLSGSPSAE